MKEKYKFQSELANLINKFSGENDSNTPDFILAQYLVKCLETFNSTVVSRELVSNEDKRKAKMATTKPIKTYKYTRILNSEVEFTLPAGKYYVGDLCYVFPDPEWGIFFHDAQDQAPEGQHWSAITEGAFEVDSKCFWYHSTAFGDGGYEDQNGHMYCVDAGIIGIIPFELAQYSDLEDLLNLGNVVTFDSEVVCKYSDGTFFIGDLVIPTGEDSEEEDR